MFLLAAYARYNGPYVWIRSNHERIVHFISEDRAEKDYPLQLKSTLNWHQGGKNGSVEFPFTNLSNFIVYS